jgi:hypothetical protein
MNTPPIIPNPPPIIGTAPAKPLAGKRDWICQQCGWIGKPKRHTDGSMLIELVLWLMLILPGLIYSLWRLTTRRKVCACCQSGLIIPCRSPRGLQLVEIRR